MYGLAIRGASHPIRVAVKGQGEDYGFVGSAPNLLDY
jgi:hypothetical protein